jgi:hypothetical protein
MAATAVQGFTPKAKGVDGKEVVLAHDFAGGMTLENFVQIILGESRHRYPLTE